MSTDAPRSLVWLAVAAAVAALSAAGWYAEDHQRGRATDDEAWSSAAAWIRAGFEPGDAIRVEPGWDDGPWAALQGLGAGTERFPFPALLRGRAVDPVEVLRHQRLWVLYTQDAATNPPAAGALGPEEERRAFAPGVTAVRYPVETAELLARMSESLDALTVSRHPAKGAAIPCPRRGGRFACAGKAWMDVRVETRDVDHMEASWLYAHPGPREAELRLRWRPAEKGKALLLRAGHTLEAVRRDRGQPATIRVFAGDREVDRFTLGRHEYTHERRLYTWEGLAPPGVWTVSIASADADWREVLLEGDLFGAVTPVLRDTATAVLAVAP
jgi:hypothetical protein